MDDPDQAKQRMYNFLFLGEKMDALLPFFKRFFDTRIEFPRTSGVFYYPSRVSDTCLMRAFAAFPSSLEMIATPKEFGEADCIVVVINVQNNDHFGDFIPFFQAILDKKLACPPVVIIGLTITPEFPRQVSYFGMVALKHFIATTFKPADSHLIEWNLQRDTFDAKRHIESMFSDVMRTIDDHRHDTRAVLTKATTRNDILNLKKEIHAWKFLDKKAGLKFLIADEYACMHAMNREGTRFPGYHREFMIKHGLDASFVKDVLDEWEDLDATASVPRNAMEDVYRNVPGLLDAGKKYLAPRSLSNLVVDLHLDLPVAKAIMREMRVDGTREVDIHHTRDIVEELSSITELIVIFASQPVFYHLPNVKMGVGSIDNIEMISGMFHVLDILRNQVYTTSQEEKKSVEKIKYGNLNITIAHGKRAKCIIHSLRGLSNELLKKMEQYIDSFERTFASTLENYKGEVNVFTERGRRLFDDIFTPLPTSQVNTNWQVVNVPPETRGVLTSNQLRVLESIESLQAEGIIGTRFHLEHVFSQIAARARLSLSDLLLLLPGELLVRDSTDVPGS
ncbi:MAG: hypothetical protein GYA24_10805 [Candidatus Lokiarchaeota archaeon]|nr:hypothetical protein [Candidatus Lokiarchaeota archaeon]